MGKKKGKRILAAMIAAQMIFGLASPAQASELPVQTEQTEKEEENQVKYEADFAFSSGVETHEVRMDEQIILVDLEWICKEMGLDVWVIPSNQKSLQTASKALYAVSQTSDVPGQYQERAASLLEDAMGEEDLCVIGKVRKRADSDFALSFCSGLDFAVVESKYMGIIYAELGAKMQMEKVDGTYRIWVPLVPFLQMVDSYAWRTQDNEIGIADFCETAVDLLHDKKLDQYDYDVMEDSGLTEKELAIAIGYQDFYDGIKGLFQGVVNLSWDGVTGAFKDFAGNDEKGGETLALQMCSYTTEEYDAISKLAQNTANAASVWSNVQMELFEKYTEVMKDDAEYFKQLETELFEKLNQSSASDRGTLFKNWDDAAAKAVDQAKKAKTADSMFETFEAMAPVINVAVNGFFAYTTLISELNQTNENYIQYMDDFLEARKKLSTKSVSEEAIKALQERIKLYQSKNQSVFSDAYLDIWAEFAWDQGINIIAEEQVGNIGKILGTGLKSLLLKGQLVSLGWDLGEMLINKVTDGSLEAADNLRMALYSMIFQEECKQIISKTKTNIRYQGSKTNPVFDETQLEDYIPLEWCRLKSFYVTRYNAVKFYDSFKDDERYEKAFGDDLRKNRELAEKMAVLVCGKLGLTQTSVEEAESSYGEYHEVLYPAVREQAPVINNGGLYVKQGKETYYWQSDAQSFENEAIFGNYSSYPQYHTNTLMRITEKEGEETIREALFQMEGTREIFLMKDRFYFQTPVEGDTWKTEVYSVDKNGEDYTYYGIGSLLAVDEENQCLVLQRQNPVLEEEEVVLLSVAEGKKLATLPAQPYREFIGFYGDEMYMVGQGQENDRYYDVIFAVSRDGEECRTVLKLSDLDYYNEWSETAGAVQNTQILDGKLYCSIGIYAGTGNFYQGGTIVSVGLDGSNPQIVAGARTMKEGQKCTEKFCVYQKEENGEKTTFLLYRYSDETEAVVHVKNLETGVEVTQSGVEGNLLEPCWEEINGSTVCYRYLENGDKQYLIAPADYQQDSMGANLFYQQNALFNIKDVEVVDNWVYYTTEYSLHNSENDFGWRYSYQRQKTRIYRKNLETQGRELLYEY
ncbi:MAG: hypothetical protein SO016_09470 [Lachnospiraceae bacterium]|nr:hypothetical protein [Robinsoniella sp.]MDY3766900.1 hypothetical protein [Lachnospiraceae bacterium]